MVFQQWTSRVSRPSASFAESIADLTCRTWYSREMAALKVGESFRRQDGTWATVTGGWPGRSGPRCERRSRPERRVLTGAKTAGSSPGNFYAPTVLTNIRRGSPAHKEGYLSGWGEASFRAADLDERFESRTTSRFGLGRAPGRRQ